MEDKTTNSLNLSLKLMEPKIARNFYLTALNPQNGYYYNFGSEFVYGLTAAIVLDLYREKRITLQNKKVIIVNPEATNYPVFDKVLELIGRKQPLSIAALIGRLAIRGQFYKKELIRLLELNKDLVRIRKSVIGISYNRYFPADHDYRMSVIRRMRDILLRNEEPSNEELLLLIILHACQLYRALSDIREERKRMRIRMKSILKGESCYTHDFENIKALSTGIQRAIQAAHATHTAASS